MTSTQDTNMTTNTVKGCGCAACQSGQPDLVNITQAQFEALNGGAIALAAATPTGDETDFANYLTTGFWQDFGEDPRAWAQDNITFSLSNEFSADQKDGLRLAFDLWADVAAIDFTEVGGGGSITIVEGDDGRAYSQATTSGTTATANLISIDTNVPGWSDFNDLGDYALMTALHEIGHALGLGHTGNYNGTATYADDAQWAFDTHQMTVMSYFNDTNVGSDHWNSTGFWQYSATPMLIDIIAIQSIYGADYTTRSAATVYGFNATAGRDVYDFSISDVPFAIWDGGGIDTLDLSGYSQDQIVDLREGAFSSVGYMTNNIVIAYGAIIENAVGGSGADTMHGNEADNTIWSGLGNDTIRTYGGNDIVHASAGLDYIYGGLGNDTLNGQSGVDYLFGEEGNDTLNGGNQNDRMFGGEGEDVLNGGNGNDLLEGGLDNDILNGDAGNDRLYGEEGDDTINAGDGIDRAFGGIGNDTINGGNDRDTIFGGDGNDILSGDAQNDRILGEDGDDTLYGGADNDLLFGGFGNDTLNGDAGVDSLYGQSDNDILNGGDSADLLDGGSGNDTLNGDSGSDRLYGRNGDDILNGGAGLDRLYGGDGFDQLWGGSGSDIFIFESASAFNDIDQIFDFNLNSRDVIDISDLLTGFTQGVSDIIDFVSITVSGSDSLINVDANGLTGGASFTTVAQINSLTGLDTASLYASNTIIV